MTIRSIFSNIKSLKQKMPLDEQIKILEDYKEKRVHREMVL